MSDLTDPIQRAVEATQPMLQISVTIFKDGHCEVRGPVDNEFLCLQVLADAMREIRRHNAKRKIVTVPGFVPPADLGGNGKG